MSFDRQEAALRYDAANRETLHWMLARPALQGAFLDTKVNPLTGADYGPADGLRGKEWTYGWIQGRGLESLAMFARHYAAADAALAAALTARAARLHARLRDMVAADGHLHFLYDGDMRPVRPEGGGTVMQEAPGAIYTFSDIFAAKGLIAAAPLVDPSALPEHLAYLERIVAAVAGGRFQMDEKVPLSPAAIALQPADFGPRMILLGAAGTLRRCGLGGAAHWAARTVTEVIDGWYDPGTGVLRNVPGGDAFNAGHGIEFAGFALDHFGPDIDPGLRDRLAGIVLASAGVALRGPGIALSVSLSERRLLSPHFPWWPLPETIRAAALALAAGAAPQEPLLDLWAQADRAFFSGYWQPGRGYAIQTLTAEGPADFVPATPDLDPGYHTGLSLLAAATA